MAYEKGGRADKYGNRYENNCVIYNLLNVIEEKKACVILEALGEAEFGVDVWVVDNNGIKEGQQCKSRCGSDEKWSFTTVNEKGLWKKWKQQLDRDNNITVSLVSPLSFTMLEDVTVRARNNSGNPSDFYKYQIQNAGKATKDFFDNVCNVIDLNPNKNDDCRKILSFFSRIYYRQMADSELENIILVKMDYLFNESSELIYSLMLKYISTKNIYGKEITAYTLNEFFQSNGITFKNLANDNRILPKIKELNEEYKKSFNLFSSGMIYREESKQCWEYIKNGQSIIIHGKSGVGKSGCTANIISFCEQENIPYLAIKLDKRIPKDNTKAWSETMSLPASISHCISSVAQNRNAVIILDQLDALRWTHAHSGLALDVCFQLINELESINYEREHKVSLVFVCRSYDLENDSGIKRLFDDKNESKWKKIEVGLLNENEIKQVVGSTFNNLFGKIRELLKFASNLYIWEKLDGTQNGENIGATYQLVKEWWNQIINKAIANHIETNVIVDLKKEMVAFCNEQGRISVPKIMLEKYASSIDFLISNDFLIESNQTISFSHQSILDCFLADQMIEKYYKGDLLVEIIGDIDKQTPGRRYQLQIFLQQLAEIHEEDFLKVGKQILEHNDIRYNLKYVFLEVLSQINSPESLTIECVLSLLESAEWKMPVISTVIRGKKEYITALISKGILDKWVINDSKEIAISLCESLSPDYNSEVVSFIRKYAIENDNYGNWERCFYRDVWEGTDDFFELRMKFYKKYPKMLSTYFDWKEMLSNCEVRTAKILALMIEYKNEKISGNINDNDDFGYMDFDDSKILIQNYMPILEQLVPCLPSKNNNHYFDPWSEQDFPRRNLERTCVRIIKAANKEFIKLEPDKFFEYYSFGMGKGNELYNEIILDAFEYIGNEYADYILNYLMQNITKNCFENYSGKGNGLYYSKKIIEKCSKVCDESVLRKLEYTVMHYISPLEKEMLRSRINYNKQKNDGERAYWSFWGAFQYEILSSIDEKRRSAEANQLLEVLKRKFNSDKTIYNYSSNSCFGAIISPVSSKKLSAKKWMEIIKNPKTGISTNSTWVKEKGVFIDHTLEDFAASFKDFVAEEPFEIIDLLINETEDIRESFIDRLFDGIASSSNIDLISNDKIECLIKKYRYNYTSDRAAYICEIVRKKARDTWSDYMYSCIKDIALNHKSLELNKLIVSDYNDKNNEKVSSIESNALNCVRGKAILTISVILENNEYCYQKFKNCISKLVDEDNFIINYAVIWILWSVFNIDKLWAIEKMMYLFAKNFKLIGMWDSNRILCFCYQPKYRTIIIDAVNKAAKSDDDRLIKESGYAMIRLHMLFDEYSNLLNIYEKSEKKLRKTMLEMLIIYFNIDNYKKQSKMLLMDIIQIENDIDNELIWGKLFENNLLDAKEDVDLIKKILCSKIKRSTFMKFGKYLSKNGNLKEYSNLIIQIVNEILEKNPNDIDLIWGLGEELSKLIIGLYDVTASSKLNKDKAVAMECLNIWDKMYERNIGMARLLTYQMMNM